MPIPIKRFRRGNEHSIKDALKNYFKGDACFLQILDNILGGIPHMSRMYKRLQISLPAIVTVNPNKQEERLLLLMTVDISASGVMFHSEQSFFPNTPVKIVFLLKQGHPQKLKVMFSGRVIRCEPGRFAVAFNEVHPKVATFQSEE